MGSVLQVCSQIETRLNARVSGFAHRPLKPMCATWTAVALTGSTVGPLLPVVSNWFQWLRPLGTLCPLETKGSNEPCVQLPVFHYPNPIRLSQVLDLQAPGLHLSFLIAVAIDGTGSDLLAVWVSRQSSLVVGGFCLQTLA